MPRTEVSAAEVLAAVREYAAKADRWIDPGYGVFRDLAERMDFEHDARDFRAQARWNRFTGQVTRALNKLADEGVLRKARQDERGPNGRYVHRGQVKFWLPAAWDAAAVEWAAQHEADTELRQRWDDLYGRTQALSLGAWQNQAGELRMHVGSWEILLELAERAAAPEGPDTASDELRAHYAEPEGLYGP